MFNEGIKEERDRFLKDLKESCSARVPNEKAIPIYVYNTVYIYIYW